MGFLREPKVEAVIGVVLALIALGFTVSPVHSLALAVFFWALAVIVALIASFNGWRRRGLSDLAPAHATPPPSDAAIQATERMRLQLNEARVQRHTDRQAAERERRALIREGYALVTRFEETDARAIVADLFKQSPDLRKWARTARAFIVTEMPGQQELPDDDLLRGSIHEKYALLRDYLRALEAHPLA